MDLRGRGWSWQHPLGGAWPCWLGGMGSQHPPASRAMHTPKLMLASDAEPIVWDVPQIQSPGSAPEEQQEAPDRAGGWVITSLSD